MVSNYIVATVRKAVFDEISIHPVIFHLYDYEFQSLWTTFENTCLVNSALHLL